MRNLYVLFIIILLEIILIPQTYTNSNFTINLFGYSLGMFELAFWIIVITTIYLLPLNKFRPIIKIRNLLTEGQNLSICMFLFFLIMSIFFGTINGNKYFLNEIRSIGLILPVFVFSLISFDFINNKKVKYYNKILIFFSVAGVSVITSFISPKFADAYSDIVLRDKIIDFYSRSISGQFGTYSLSMAAITMLVYFVGISNILFKHKYFKYYLMTIIGFVSTNIFFHKPVVVSFFLGNVIMFIIYNYLNKGFSSVINSFKYIIIAIICIVFFVMILPTEIATNFANYFYYGWLNIGRTGVEDDLSSGRFTLFQEYGSYALSGWGFAPWGIGKELSYLDVTTPHNYIIYLAFQIGVIPTLILLYLIFSILKKTLFKLKYYNNNKKNPVYPIVFAIFVYLNTLLIQAQYSGTLDKMNSYIFLFYSLLAILVHLNKELDKSILE
jgi:hypothetical protein